MEKKVRWLKNAVEVDLFKLSGLLQSKFSLDLRRADGKRKIVYLLTRETMVLLNLDSGFNLQHLGKYSNP